MQVTITKIDSYFILGIAISAYSSVDVTGIAKNYQSCFVSISMMSDQKPQTDELRIFIMRN